jgi:hypothetical protein
MEHEKLMQSIELYRTKVIPLARSLLARTHSSRDRPQSRTLDIDINFEPGDCVAAEIARSKQTEQKSPRHFPLQPLGHCHPFGSFRGFLK